MPKLKGLLDALDGLDDATRGLYTKREDGKYVLDVEGLVEKGRLDEFRSTNVTLKEQVEALTKQLDGFKGIDPAKYKALLDKLEGDEEKKLLEGGKLDEVVGRRTQRMRTEFDEQLAAKDKALKKLEDEKAKAYKERDTYIIDAELRRAVDHPDFGFQSGVADLLKPQVLQEFTFREGKVVRVKVDGSIVYGKGGDPASLTEFLQDVAKERPYLVKPSNGSGARNEGGRMGTGKSIRRAEFNSLSPVAQATYCKEGGVVVD